MAKQSDSTDSNCRQMNILKIYADKDGNSRFGSFTIKMEGSGEE